MKAEVKPPPAQLAEGVHIIWSTRPGSQAPAAKRHALRASRAKLGREPATPTLATCSDPWIPLRFSTKPPQGAAYELHEERDAARISGELLSRGVSCQASIRRYLMRWG